MTYQPCGVKSLDGYPPPPPIGLGAAKKASPRHQSYPGPNARACLYAALIARWIADARKEGIDTYIPTNRTFRRWSIDAEELCQAWEASFYDE